MTRKLFTTILAAALLAPFAMYAAEEDPNTNLVKRVQIRLHELGFDPGVINGENSGQTQAALTQFQLSWMLPASGMIDEPTLFVLDVPREEASAATGGSAPAGR